MSRTRSCFVCETLKQLDAVHINDRIVARAAVQAQGVSNREHASACHTSRHRQLARISVATRADTIVLQLEQVVALGRRDRGDREVVDRQQVDRAERKTRLLSSTESSAFVFRSRDGLIRAVRHTRSLRRQGQRPRRCRFRPLVGRVHHCGLGILRGSRRD